METIAVHCSWADAQLATDISLQLSLPPELRTQILTSTGSEYLDALAAATRLPTCTDRLFVLYNPVFVEIVNRWTAEPYPTLLEDILTLCSLARILPFAPYLKSHVRNVLDSSAITSVLSSSPKSATGDLDDERCSNLLIALFRLLSYDRDYFDGLIHPIFFSSLLNHETLHIRYLAVECLCLVMHFADAFCESLLRTYLGKQPVTGIWEGQRIDFRLLKLWEEQRWNAFETEVERCRQSQLDTSDLPAKTLLHSNLQAQTAVVGDVLLPRTESAAVATGPFVLTPSAQQALNQLGAALLEQKPVVLVGPASSGKTMLVLEAARLLHKAASMITLHLNEQTDAKSLIGLHASSPTDNRFVWQPGVLARALQQGRWVLIEDIDRAPPEVLGVLRPVIENGDLLIPSRKERVRAADGFRILATVRASSSESSKVLGRTAWLGNPRLWTMLHTQNYSVSETSLLLSHSYPSLAPLLETILELHRQIVALYESDATFKAAQGRTPSLRDLLKLCRRTSKRAEAENLRLSSRPVPESFQIAVFKDAVDCYGSHLSDDLLYNKVAASVAQSMNISPQQMQYYIAGSAHPVQDTPQSVKIGRTELAKITSRRVRTPSSPFADSMVSRRCIESISAGIDFAEAYLLVGETGVGKTALIQHIAALVGQKLTVINLSQQSEATDLLGGLKPVTTRSLVLPLIEEFNALFDDTFSASKNDKFQTALSKAFARQNWARLLKLWQEAMVMAETALRNSTKPTAGTESQHGSKRRKVVSGRYDSLRQRWAQFTDHLNRVRPQLESGDKNHAFAFVEGRLIQAVRNGEWVLLDEINLASSDTLDHVVSLLHDGDNQTPSIFLTEAGSVEKIQAHPDFRVFAAMNPATDTGKKDLAPGLRSRFTELYVHSGDRDLEDLVKVIQSYLGRMLEPDKRAASALANAYMEVQKLNHEHKLTDGAGDLPHFSIRSLVRCLLYTIQHGASHGLRRAMYEGFAMSFFTVLSCESEALVLPSTTSHLLANIKNLQSFLAQQPKVNADGQDFVAFRHHLIVKGPFSPDFQPHYIRTASVERNLINLARAASMRRFPILLQGPTSAGKTSMVEYLAKLSGNKFVRINNHEHTDLQEYLGSYISDSDGKLKFKDGVLVDALRQGYWLVLDELNLAPSDVLEALNRLLDDNRELLIPETQEIIRPHPNFMLFATQNPAGLYGGRKRLSRAFRNRFLEIHFDDIPENELEIILRERSQIAPSFCTQIVAVYKKLSLLRQSSRLFEQRNSFATLRDLFRWALRPVDDRQQLAHHGFMLLGERVRDPVERDIVKKTIEETMKVVINEDNLYGMSTLPSNMQDADGIVWTRAMRRLFVLVSSALKNREPVLLVGETGCGKTQICQVMAQAFGRPLNIYNAHTNTETGDLIGSQRPVRSRSQLAAEVMSSLQHLDIEDTAETPLDLDSAIASFDRLNSSYFDPQAVQRAKVSIAAYQSLFEWSDGSLVRSMKSGEHFLLDEISLTDDSVLERLNSVLEPARTIMLAEKGSMDNMVVAHADFQFLATMNPGGDYGKRELSAALRNRLTEIWVPPLSQEEDVLPILHSKLKLEHTLLAPLMLKFSLWFKEAFHTNATTTIPLRDLLAWAQFMNYVPHLSSPEAFLHGAALVCVDSIGANPAGMVATISDVESSRLRCLESLQTMTSVNVAEIYNQTPQLILNERSLEVGQFSLAKATDSQCSNPDLVFEAPTTLKNTMRLVRALQMDRPVLLEGSPGVGKTAIVTALAQLLGRSFTRINLSDQTDLMDLFGADAPAEDEALGRFVWKDGPLLQAMQTGGWVLLDEMNLASQSVLEGLNSCLDHRKEVYIAELDKTFACHPDFTLFAAQNPHHQGGGRKGLPASFVNRFTVVYADPFKEEDLRCICRTTYPAVNQKHIENVVQGVSQADSVAKNPAFGVGGPWEANLRDASRWLQLCQLYPKLGPMYHYTSIIDHRFRNLQQHRQLQKYATLTSQNAIHESFYFRLTSEILQVGLSFLPRNHVQQPSCSLTPISVKHLPQAKSIITAISQGWPIVLVGCSGAGKTRLIRSLAAVGGAQLLEVSMNADVDTMDLLGGFEQYDEQREIEQIKEQARKIANNHVRKALSSNSTASLPMLLELARICESQTSETEALLSALQGLSGSNALANLAQQLRLVMNHDQKMRSRFVWNDGVLVEAVQEGYWLVLDNANLCNASVLDRLNSLLEPNGQLVISEQHNADGGVRRIKPHPDFRIILTVDPRYGELSRAMRNRSLEVFLDQSHDPKPTPRVPMYPWTASISRLRDIFLGAQEQSSIMPFLDNLSCADLELLKMQISPQSGTQQYLTGMHPIIERFVAGNEKILPKIRDLMSMLRNVKNPQAPSLECQPQLLLLNEPIFSGLDSQLLGPRIGSLQRIWHVGLDILEIRAQLSTAAEHMFSSGGQGKTALEHSIITSRGSKRNDYVTPPFYQFATMVIQCFWDILVSLAENESQSEMLNADSMMDNVLFVKDMLSLASSPVVDMAVFQALRQIGRSMASPLCQSSSPHRDALDKAWRLFKTTTLNRGLGLQRMWHVWKPRTPATLEQLETKIVFEKMVERLDEIEAMLPQPRSEVLPVKQRLVRAAECAWEGDDSAQVLESANEAMSILEAQAERRRPVEAQFQELFDFISRREVILDALVTPWGFQTLNSVCHFGGARTAQSLRHGPVQEALQKLVKLRTEFMGHGIRVGALLRRISQLPTQPLRGLYRLREETSEVSKVLSTYPALISRDLLPSIRKNVEFLLSGILLSHGQFLAIPSSSRPSATDAFDLSLLRRLAVSEALVTHNDEQAYFQSIYQSHLKPGFEHLSFDSQASIGRGILLVSMAALVLMVPDKPFDPAVHEQVVHGRFKKRVSELETKIEAQRRFNQRLMGQDSSLALRLLERDLAEIGDEPLGSAVTRPAVSQLDKVQEEFNNLQRTIIDAPPNYLLQHDVDPGRMLLEAQRLNQDVNRLVARLGKVHRAYDDLVVPISQLLQCLGLGACLVASSVQQVDDTNNSLEVFAHVPLLGALPSRIIDWPVDRLFSQYSDAIPWLKNQILHRRLAWSVSPVGYTQSQNHHLRVLDLFYQQWKSRLSDDQREAEAKSRYYSYRGDDDIEDEEDKKKLATMFPVYEDESNVPPDAGGDYNGRTTAIQLASLHEQMFTYSGKTNVRDFILEALQSGGSASSTGTNATFDSVLPGLLLQIEREAQSLAGSNKSAAINIYNDSDINEAQKLFKLVQDIQGRFYEIGDRWPEHAVPTEVIAFAEETLDFPLNSPLAKLLTKAEKLLEIIGQWQSVASREWSVTSLMDGLTALIVSWRRLELASWSRLLDLEKRTNDDDAQAWYFIAYEAVIFNSRRVVETGADVAAYCLELVRTIEEFLTSTTLGQYVPKLRLLQTLQKSLDEAAQQDAGLSVISVSVASIIAHYQRYAPSIGKTLQTGRAELEKAVIEQIKLASWKDTNVTALRDSARRSHGKLFRIVRKYRALLGKPITGMKSEELSGQQNPDSKQLLAPKHNDDCLQKALSGCLAQILNWSSRPERLRNPLAATASLRHVYQAHASEFEVSTELVDFQDELADSIRSLRKENPSKVTDDNASLVRHLHERKRRLFADTIHSVTQLGVRRNLGTAELEKQSSVATILSATPDLSISGTDANVSSVNAAFHDLIDAMSPVRNAPADHSPDLTDGEVRRSVGLLEGLLSLSIRQRKATAKSLTDFEALDSSILSMRTIANRVSQVSLQQEQTIPLSTLQVICWLPAILEVACQIVQFQVKNSELALQPLLDGLQLCSEKLRMIQDQLRSKVMLPRGLINDSEIKAYDEARTALSELQATLEEWERKEPNIQYLTKQLLPWTKLPDESQDRMKNGVHHCTVQAIDEAANLLANSAFVALQQLTTIKSKPVSNAQEPGWLVQNEKWHIESWGSLHVHGVAEAVQDLLGKLQHVSAQHLPLALSLATVVAPILEQFHLICQHMLGKQVAVHLETCRLACYLAKTFATLASEGFCSPNEPSQGEEQEGKMESGTGLGDGEGAEDISKDVGADEDLDEFAKSGDKDDKEGSIVGAEDAVDMGADELEGETGEAEQKEGEESSGSEDGQEGEEMDEETGRVDDLDPTAVDEKMWDDVKEQAEKEEKELKGEKGKGERSDDQAAADEGAKEDGEDEDVDGGDAEANKEEIDDEDKAGTGKAEAENADPHLQEEKALDLPEEMQLNGEEEVEDQEGSDDGMDDLSDVGQPEGVDEVEDPDREDERSLDGARGDDADNEDEEREGHAQDDEVMEDQPTDDKDVEKDLDEREDEMQFDEDRNAGGESGAANQPQDDIDPDQKNEGQNQNDHLENDREQQGGQMAENEKDGKLGRGMMERGQSRETTLEQQQNEALKKLADVLDQWHQRREIFNPSQDRQQGKLDQDIDMAEADFEHLDDEDEGDAQALGAAAADQVQNLDQSRAIQDEDLPIEDDTVMPDVQEQRQDDRIADTLNRLQANAAGKRQEDGSFVPDSHDKRNVSLDNGEANTPDLVDEATSEIDHLELGPTQPPSPPTDSADATQLWNYCSHATHQFSLILTEQLRLILSPTTATKLRGDYRTGKRLNLKRIIPYIASGYKRDKIWMRRSVPSKRNYQIMLAVDDSKSMAESGADLLALQTTAMLCKSLAMLEVGDVSVLSFGEGKDGIKIAHPFGDVWKGDESGVEVFRNFSFNQKGTDVRALMERGLAELKEARLKVQGGREETWQLFLIISDGHCGEHERVRRLVREGKGERVLTVFIILDNLDVKAENDAGVGEERKGDSILDLKEAVFEPDPTREGEMRVVTRRYLERFPFEFYLVVRDMRDLPGVLARCLRGWFGGVEGS